MHVLVFYQYFVTNDVAGSTRPYEIGRRLLQQGARVTVIAGDSVYATGQRAARMRLLWKRERVEGLEIIRVRIPCGGSRRILPRILGFLWFIPAGLLAALTVRDPDIVVASSTPLTIGLPAWAVGVLRRVPFVFELRDLWPDCVAVWNVVRNRPLVRAAYWLESFLYRRARFLIALTEGIRQELIAKGIAPERIRVVTNASDLGLFSPDGPGADLETIAGIPRDAFVCIHAGSLGLANSLGLLLDVAGHLRDHPSIHFVLMGAGRERPLLVQEAARRGLTSVHFLDPVPKAMVPAFLRRAQLGIVTVKPSRLSYIFLPNKFFDYLACGCPILLNFGGEGRRAIESANAGVWVPPDDPRVFAQTVARLSASPDRLQSMRRNARKLAEERFGWDHKVKQFGEILSLALEGQPQRVR